MKTQLPMWPHRLINHFYRQVFIATIVALVSILLVFTPAHAQTTSLSIWPPILEAMIKPGKSITQVYRIKNLADDTTIKVSVVPFSASDEFGHLNLQFGGRLPRFFSLLNADLPELPVSLNLKAGESQELVLKITVPANTEDADYPVALTIESQTAGLIGGSGSVARATIASPILLTVSRTGTPNRIAKIETFQTRSNLVIDSFSPIEFILRVKNQSVAQLQAVGQITINNTFGRAVATLPLQPDHILAGTIRQLSTSKVENANTLEVDGSSEVSGLVWNPVFPLGRYTAEAEITPQDSSNTVSQTITFWVIPYKALLTLGLLLAGYQILTITLKQQKLKL